MNTIKGIIFDLDGTLINTSINFTVMKERMINFLEENGIPKDILTPKQTTVVIIATSEKILRENGKQQVDIDLVRQTLEEIMNQGELDAVQDISEIDGVQNALQNFRESGYKLAVLTRSHHAYAVEALTKIGAYDLFDVILGRGETPKPKPYREALEHTATLLNLNLNEIIFIGDNHIDANSAANAEVFFIGVKTGRHGDFSWDGCFPEVLLESVIDLPAYLRGKK
ncbi:MAG: HAD-IA family hydrolase [Candidatus Bathyarchaeota archaeon]|nr:HAD-IA family hydrolase [Candidatus Bathyarchaeota archaeon]